MSHATFDFRHFALLVKHYNWHIDRLYHIRLGQFARTPVRAEHLFDRMHKDPKSIEAKYSCVFDLNPARFKLTKSLWDVPKGKPADLPHSYGIQSLLPTFKAPPPMQPKTLVKALPILSDYG